MALRIDREEVSQPAGWQPGDYQRLLLNRLADADPAAVLAATPATMRELAREAGSAVRDKPAAGEWSVFECIAHICDAALVFATRYRWILAHDAPAIAPYDQDLWVNALHSRPDESVEELLGWLEPLRRSDLVLWQRASSADKARYGMHGERGLESYALTFHLGAGHELLHIDQARQALAQVLAQG